MAVDTARQRAHDREKVTCSLVVQPLLILIQDRQGGYTFSSLEVDWYWSTHVSNTVISPISDLTHGMLVIRWAQLSMFPFRVLVGKV